MPKLVTEPAQRFLSEIEEKDILKIEKRLRSSKYGHHLLGPDESVSKIILQDEQNLKSIGITCEQIAGRLETIIGLAHRHKAIWGHNLIAHGCDVTLGSKNFRVNMLDCLDDQRCPFRRGKNEDKTQDHDCGLLCGRHWDSLIQNLGNNTSVYLDLHIVHLIRDHHFFGAGKMQRQDPLRLVQLLDIKTGEDCQPKKVDEEYWQFRIGGDPGELVEEEFIETHYGRKTCEDNLTIYLANTEEYKKLLEDKLASGRDFACESEMVIMKYNYQKEMETIEEMGKSGLNTRRLTLVANAGQLSVRGKIIENAMLDQCLVYKIAVFANRKRKSFVFSGCNSKTITASQ